MPHAAPVIFHEAHDAPSLAQALARFVALRLQEALDRRGQALLVVSGGSTPVPFFEALSRTPLDWPKVTVTLADERWVPPEHADSNERLVRAHLLAHLAASTRFVPLKLAHPHAAEAVPALSMALDAMPWPADVVVLGMGGDAHTASLFPGSPELAEALDTSRPARCLAISPPALPNVPVERISLSQRALLDTREVVVHLTGASKRQLLNEALQPGPVRTMPIRLAWSGPHIPCQIFCSN